MKRTQPATRMRANPPAKKKGRPVYQQILEVQLKDFGSNGVITGARFVETKNGWLLIVNLSWKKGDHCEYTYKNKPRVWVSVDRMLKHLREAAPYLRDIKFEFLDG